MRKYAIGALTNIYPAFVTLHLLYGDWCRKCQVLFNIAPIAVFGGLFLIWYKTSHKELSKSEKYFIGYLFVMLTVIYTYYILCLYSSSGWVANHNYQFAAYLIITGIYYVYQFTKRWKL